MADFLSSSSSPIPPTIISTSSTQDLSPNSSPGASLFQDSTKFLQQLGFLDAYSSTGFSGENQQQQQPTSSASCSNIASLARNSTKTLKCPKCNWHYKYQEALENHLKDKHPDVEVTCIYCIQNLPHPKLARGETYSCGYKPFRCTICNYSTTTKGNLSIHMQSDKHLHAMQDIPTNINPITSQSGGGPQTDQADNKTYYCLICGTFSSDSIEDLISHLNIDRSQTNSADISSMHGIYQCYLCPYTTNLKANFQLHMRTDKHIQRVQMINHMRENVLAATSPTSNLLCRLSTAKTGVQVKCRPCFEILTSIESIREHCQSSAHLTRNNFMQNSTAAAVAAAVLGFQSGDESEGAMDLSMESPAEESNFQCIKCDFSTFDEESAIEHLQDHNFTPTESPNASSSLLPLIDQIPEDNDEILELLEMNSARLKCNQCKDFMAASIEEFQSHLDNHPSEEDVTKSGGEIKCPLCDLPKEMASLESHLLNDHKITADVAKKLMVTNGIGNENDSSAPSSSPIYKYHCKLCPMIFRTSDGYQMHSLKHIFTQTHKCTRCNRSFKSIQSLRNHMTNKHDLSSFDQQQTHDNSCSICSENFENRQALQTHIYSIEHLHKAKKFLEQQSTGKLGQQLNEQVLSLLSKVPKNGMNDSSSSTTTPSSGSNSSNKKPYKCNVCRLSYGQGSTLDIHLRSVAHQTRIGRLAELVASGEVDASCAVSEQPGGITQKTIGELILPSTMSELEKLQRSDSPMDVAAASAAPSASTLPSTAIATSQSSASSRKRKAIDDESASSNPFEAFQNMMNMSQLFGQFSNENMENGNMDFNALAALSNSGDLQNFLLSQQQHQQQQQLQSSSSLHSSQASSPQASPSSLVEEISDEPKTGKCLRHSLEADGMDILEQFFSNISSVKHNIDRIPESEISELCKVDCPNCDTVFPSIWILKKHAKDSHSSNLPLEAIQQFSEKLKQALDDLEEQSPSIKKQKIEEITNNLKAGKLNGTSAAAKSKKSEVPEAMDQLPNLAMMSMLAGSNFPMLMNPFLSMMNPDMLAAASGGNNGQNNNNGTTIASSPGLSGDFAGQQRRARTKITDDQLRVLKTYFDISNSPTEQQVKEMARKTGLLEKVIKHWFRNTLFKERQRDKDSPYNFNVPPQLSIDLDTYEKTGEAKIKQVKSEDNDDASNVSTPAPSTPISMPILEIKKEPKFVIKQEPKVINDSSSQAAAFVTAASEFMANLNKACNNNNFNPFALLSQAALSSTPTSTDKSFNDMLASSTSMDLTSPLPSATPNGTGASGGGSGGSGRRANRTRFTDIQLRSLQQFFDKQAYPKDDDLEMLSKKLNLSPRVIVVWFQNARQKARKIYENTPNLDNNERFVRTPGQNFQCKRCQLVFPRYYELIQHQQKVCYVNDNDAQENDNKFVEEMMSDDEKPTTSYDNTSSSATVNITTGEPLMLSSTGHGAAPTSPMANQSTMETLNQLLNGSVDETNVEKEDDQQQHQLSLTSGSIASSDELLKFLTGKCDSATLNKLLESTTTHKSQQQQQQQQQQIDDYTNEQIPLDLSTSPTFADDSHHHSRRESSLNYLDTDFDFSSVLSSVSPTNFPSMLANTFFNGASPNHQQRSPSATSLSNNQHGANSKRYRTHLTPLQVYVMKALFNDYKTPSMTECDILGKEIGLNKRVVQVWFQNARAKERKCRSVTGDEDLPKTGVDCCSMCSIDFNSRTPKLTMQDHIFTKRHIGFLSERFNSRSTSQSSNPGRHEGSLSPPPPAIQEPPQPQERVRARAVRDSGGSRKQSASVRPSSTNNPQFPFNLMYGLQSGSIAPFMCDPTILGTPIAALQIPTAVMQQIQIDIQAGKDSTKFTQDGLELKDLKSKIAEDDFKCVTTVTNEVGYACPGCSYTFQQQPQLETHQKIICPNFDGKIFKLMQIHYECIACNTKTGTQDDFKKHIESANHQQIRNLFSQPVIENFLTASSSSSSAM